MSEKKWRGAKAWRDGASDIAPAIVGGSKKHGGPDLGPTRAKQAWAELGVNGHLVAEEPPERDFVGMPVLTVRMVARLQAFPDNWQIAGGRTQAYRQVGNAFPPPVAQAVAEEIACCLSTRRLGKAS
jgi:DNA (cytosine-5)-methyltransferase 1